MKRLLVSHYLTGSISLARVMHTQLKVQSRVICMQYPGTTHKQTHDFVQLPVDWTAATNIVLGTILYHYWVYCK